ncbi:MAG: hypothetical protein ABUS48_00060 [Pseudomonadota bacterium]
MRKALAIMLAAAPALMAAGCASGPRDDVEQRVRQLEASGSPQTQEDIRELASDVRQLRQQNCRIAAFLEQLEIIQTSAGDRLVRVRRNPPPPRTCDQ